MARWWSSPSCLKGVLSVTGPTNTQKDGVVFTVPKQFPFVLWVQEADDADRNDVMHTFCDADDADRDDVSKRAL
eukprot:1148645-Pelagomonas_calceolata.AAC.5